MTEMSDKLNHSKVQALATAYQSPLPVLLFFQNISLRKRIRLSREMVLLLKFDVVKERVTSPRMQIK
jgi:hypothetical protein